MNNKLTLISILLLSSIFSVYSQSKSKIELKDNWYYLNGHKFFIKAIGYEIGAHPGQHPYEGKQNNNLDLLKFDLKVIKEGGYTLLDPTKCSKTSTSLRKSYALFSSLGCWSFAATPHLVPRKIP